MNSALATWLVLILALCAANLPFVNERLLGIVPLAGRKRFVLRLVELALLYLVVGMIARLLEGRIGLVFEQGGFFYAITGCMFIVFAFPGFVLRYLRLRRG